MEESQSGDLRMVELESLGKDVIGNAEFQVVMYFLLCLYSTELSLVVPPQNMHLTVSALSKREGSETT